MCIYIPCEFRLQVKGYTSKSIISGCSKMDFNSSLINLDQ